MKKQALIGLMVWGILLGVAACQQADAAVPVVTMVSPTAVAELPATLTVASPTAPILPTEPPTAVPTDLPATATATPTAVPMTFSGVRSPVCGQQLPLLPTHTSADMTRLNPTPEEVAFVESLMPATAVAAWAYMLAHPENVSLVAYRMGDEANGIYLNGERQMPLASVVKLLPLVAYVEAVATGELDPLSAHAIDDIDRYYLPGYDLNAHRRALTELDEQERLFGQPSQVLLQELPWMMIRHSSNAAADYLQLLLGQERIEQTAVALGLVHQTAPCLWLGQFLAMGNQWRTGDDATALAAYMADPSLYAEEASLLADLYSQDEHLREMERHWHQETRRPSLADQRFFSHQLNAHGTAVEYAALMMRLAQNGLSHPDSSFLARRYLEWPMTFPANQALFSNLGYKNGSLPGILTTVYYAYPIGQQTPVVVALFFRDLPQEVYREWRTSLPHDELARWLLADPLAITAVRSALQP